MGVVRSLALGFPSMVKPRHAARILLIDDRERALLFRYRNPYQRYTFWVPPGGGVDAGETHRAAAVRELAEETGRDDIDIGPEIWRRDHTFRWGTRKLRQRERWFLATTPAFEVPTAVVRSLAQEGVKEARWWSVDELLHTDALLTPRRLATLLRPLLAGDIPQEVAQIGRDPNLYRQGHLRNRGPSGPPRSGKSGTMAQPLSRRPVTYRCAL